MGSVNLTVGRMLCGQVRDFLESCKFKGMDIEYLESSGWLERDFTVKGSNDDIIAVHQSFKDWMKRLDDD